MPLIPAHKLFGTTKQQHIQNYCDSLVRFYRRQPPLSVVGRLRGGKARGTSVGSTRLETRLERRIRLGDTR